MIEELNALIDSIYEANADSFVLVTSRPQGYQDELSRRTWSHWEMANLSSPDALRFGAQLADVLVPDMVRRREINEGLKLASLEEATAPLMTSPLQVSLLFALVETRNNIPKDRWTLFYRYYEILRDREIAKGGENGRLIGQYRSEIDRLHFEAGYLLHLRGETSGNASPFFSLEELAKVVEGQLTRSGYDDDIESLTTQIVALATTRLVFLRCRTSQQVAFDVRSLQEFMAAARIMASPEDKIKNRLKLIAGTSHWLHVFKISCSKVYSSADLESLREEILAILDSLDSGDRTDEDALVKSGAHLALELLIDGVCGAVPASKRNLMSRAMRLLSTSSSEAPFLLERAIDTSTIRSVEIALLTHFKDGGSQTRKKALQLLLLLVHADERNVADWAKSFVLPLLPSDAVEVLSLITTRRLIPPEGPLLDWLREALWNSPVAHVRRWGRFVNANDRTNDQLDFFSLIGVLDRNSNFITLKSIEGRSTSVGFTFRRIEDVPAVKSLPARHHPNWEVLYAVGQFCSNPTPSSLGSLLRYLDTRTAGSIPYDEVPWIVMAAFILKFGKHSLADISTRVEQGYWGDVSAWEECERRWMNSGVFVSDFKPSDSFGLFFPGQELTPRMLSPSSFQSAQEASLRNETVETLLRLKSDFPGSGSFSDRLVLWFVKLKRRAFAGSFPEGVLAVFLRKARKISSEPIILSNINFIATLNREDFLNENVQECLRVCSEGLSALPIMHSSLSKTLIDGFLDDPQRRYLLPLIAGALPGTRISKENFYNFYDLVSVIDVGAGDLLKEAVALFHIIKGQDVDPSVLKTVRLDELRKLLQFLNNQDTRAEILHDVCKRRLVDPTLHIDSAGETYRILKETLEGAKSKLDVPQLYKELRLPEPI